MRYEDYIASPEWAERRRLYWSTHPQACTMCATGERVELHHLVYDPERSGSEPDDDLLPLCHAHHQGVHQLHAQRADWLTLREATAEYVAAAGVSLVRGEAKAAPRNHDTWEQQVVASCPTCGAPAGDPCVRVVHGRRQAMRFVHQARRSASRRVAT